MIKILEFSTKWHQQPGDMRPAPWLRCRYSVTMSQPAAGSRGTASKKRLNSRVPGGTVWNAWSCVGRYRLQKKEPSELPTELNPVSYDWYIYDSQLTNLKPMAHANSKYSDDTVAFGWVTWVRGRTPYHLWNNYDHDKPFKYQQKWHNNDS